MFGGLSGAAGSLAGAAIQADAVKDATRMQIDALEKARDFIFKNLDPDVVNAEAIDASIEQAKNRLALQGKLDPTLLNLRYASEDQMANMASQLGQGAGDAVSAQATIEALSGGDTAAQGKQALIDAALKELSMGATLPHDVQAEIVQSGLERTGQMTGSANAQGVGGTMLRKVLGTAGLQLQQQRQQQASALLGSAQQLESSRANILGTLFPNLTAQQINNLGASQGVLKTSNEMVPNVGLNAQDIANLWLGRVGQTASLMTKAGEVGAAGQIGAGQAWSNAAGGISSGLGKVGAAAWPSVKGWFGGGNDQAAYENTMLFGSP